MRRIILLSILIACYAAPARSAELTRVLKTFDFEERRLGNEESLPMHWQKVTGPGLPHYVNGQLTTDRHRSGQYSFRFDLNGGGLIYRYAPGLIKVQRWAHYRIEGCCQTTVLPNARARLSAYFVDVDGHQIAGSVKHSELYAATRDAEPWKQLSVELTAEPAEADSLVIELELLQPMHYAVSRLGERALFEQDIHGSAWWDDVTVSQVPEVAVRTERPANIFHVGQPLRLGVLVDDRFTEDLVAQLSVRDADGKEVYQRTGTPDLQAATPAGVRRKRMIVELPELPVGWYSAAILMSSGGKTLGSQSLRFAVMADDGEAPAVDDRFGFSASAIPFDAWDQLPDVLRLLAAGRVKLPVWNRQSGLEETDEAAFDRLLTRFQERGIQTTACLLSPPPALLEKIHGSTWRDLLKSSSQGWQSALDLLISRHANHLEHWQLGEDSSPEFVTDPAMRDVYRRVYGEFSRLIESPDLAMPWPAWYELSADAPRDLALSIPTSVLPWQLPLYLQDLRDRPGHRISLSLAVLEGGAYGREVQMRDLAQRVVYALAAGARRIDLPLPAVASRDEDGVFLEPTDLFLVIRTLIANLSGAQFKGKVPIAQGVEAFLFDRQGHGILVLWAKGDQAGTKELAINLGPHPASVDLWGNVAPLAPSAGGHSAHVALRVGPMPFFLVDIDGPQAQLRASVAIDRPLLESSFHPHERQIHFVNPYPEAISGTLHLKGPPGWTFNPPTFNFNLSPGQSFDRPVSIQFPYNSFAGPKTLNCEFLLQQQRNDIFAVPLTLKLGLSDVGMQTIALRDGQDIFVQQMITNYGDAPINYTAFALYPRQARQDRLVVNLAPGATTIRRYRFPRVRPQKDARVRVGLQELEGRRVLNDEVEVQ